MFIIIIFGQYCMNLDVISHQGQCLCNVRLFRIYQFKMGSRWDMRVY